MAVAAAVGVAEAACVAVGVAVGVWVAVGVGVTIGVAVAVPAAVGVGVGDPLVTAAKISIRPQPYTLLGGPAVPHCVEEIKTAWLSNQSRLAVI